MAFKDKRVWQAFLTGRPTEGAYFYMQVTDEPWWDDEHRLVIPCAHMVGSPEDGFTKLEEGEAKFYESSLTDLLPQLDDDCWKKARVFRLGAAKNPMSKRGGMLIKLIRVYEQAQQQLPRDAQQGLISPGGNGAAGTAPAPETAAKGQETGLCGCGRDAVVVQLPDGRLYCTACKRWAA